MSLNKRRVTSHPTTAWPSQQRQIHVLSSQRSQIHLRAHRIHSQAASLVGPQYHSQDLCNSQWAISRLIAQRMREALLQQHSRISNSPHIKRSILCNSSNSNHSNDTIHSQCLVAQSRTQMNASPMERLSRMHTTLTATQWVRDMTVRLVPTIVPLILITLSLLVLLIGI